MTWPSANTEAASEAARPKLVANVKSNRSSSGVAARCASCGSRPVMRRELWGMTPVPASIVLIPKDLSVVRRNEMGRVDTMGPSGGDEIVDGRVVTLTSIVDQTEMKADCALAMEVEVCPHGLVRVHVHPIHEPSRLVRPNGQQTDSWGAVLLVDVAKVRAVRAVAGKINAAFRRLDQECAPQCLVRVSDPPARCVDRFEKMHVRVLDRNGFVPVEFCIRRQAFAPQKRPNAAANQNSRRGG